MIAGGRTLHYDYVLRNNFTVARIAEDPMDAPNGCGPAFTSSYCGSGVLIQQVASPSALSPANFDGYFTLELVGADNAGARIGVIGNIFTDPTATITSPSGFLSQADVNDGGALIQPTSSTANVTGSITGPVDSNGRVTGTMTITSGNSASSLTLNLAIYILAPESSMTGQPGRAFAVDITPIVTSKQVLSGQFFAITTPQFPAPPPPFNNGSISGVNVFAVAGVTGGMSNTSIGTLDATSGQLLIDLNSNGKFNGGGGATPQSGPITGTIATPINVAPNGRAVLTATVGNSPSTFVLYLDAQNDGQALGTDSTVSFGIFTSPLGNFNNSTIRGTYASGTVLPVLPQVPNGVSQVTLTPIGQNPPTFSGSFSAGSTNGTYSFDQTTGRGIALANSGQIFGNNSAVFYVITPHFLVIMGADQGVNYDAIGYIQF